MLPTVAGVLAFFGVFTWVIGLAIGGGYVGGSGVASGSVVQLQGDRPVVQYTVDATSYQRALAEHGSNFAVGQTIQMCYSQSDPAKAGSCSSRFAAAVMGWVGGVLVLGGVAFAAWAMLRRRRQTQVIQRGNVVMADITGTHVNKQMHMGAKVLWYVDCAWTNPMTNETYQFTTMSVWSSIDPREVMERAGVGTLPVYIDPDEPDKNYFVDDQQVVALVAAEMRKA